MLLLALSAMIICLDVSIAQLQLLVLFAQLASIIRVPLELEHAPDVLLNAKFVLLWQVVMHVQSGIFYQELHVQLVHLLA